MDIMHHNASILKAEQIDLMEDELIGNFFLMNSYWQLFAVIGSYLFIVLKLGPRLMKNRPPFDLKYVMVVYNFLQLLFNSSFILLLFSKPNIVQYFNEQSCHPSYDRPLGYRLFCLEMGWVWLMMKIFDLVDTVFFVLRKKQSHVTFLHIYHHTTVVVAVWLYLRHVREYHNYHSQQHHTPSLEGPPSVRTFYELRDASTRGVTMLGMAGEQAGGIAIVNCTVHFFMYLYYLLAALGPKVQKYLWWKRYITRLQLVQFGIFTVYFGHFMIFCDIPPMQKIYNYWVVSQGVVFTVLFLKFYTKAYTKTSISAKTDEKSN